MFNEVQKCGEGKVDYSEKFRDSLNDSEQLAVDVLVDYGFKVKPLKELDEQKNIDFEVNNKLIECKNITSKTSAHSQTRRARIKFCMLNIEERIYIFTDVTQSLSHKEFRNYIRKETRKGETSYAVIDGRLYVLKK